MMMMMMMMVVMVVARRDDPEVAVMMVMMMMVVMIIILRDVFVRLLLLRGQTGIVRLQSMEGIRDRLQQVTIACRRRALRRFRYSRLRGGHCRQRGRSSQKSGNPLIHGFPPICCSLFQIHGRA